MWARGDKVVLNCIGFHNLWSPLAIGMNRKECEVMKRGTGVSTDGKGKGRAKKQARKTTTCKNEGGRNCGRGAEVVRREPLRVKSIQGTRAEGSKS
jgi:hypothetical protein